MEPCGECGPAATFTGLRGHNMVEEEAINEAREWSRKYLGCFVGEYEDGFSVTGCHPRLYKGRFVAEFWRGERIERPPGAPGKLAL